MLGKISKKPPRAWYIDHCLDHRTATVARIVVKKICLDRKQNKITCFILGSWELQTDDGIMQSEDEPETYNVELNASETSWIWVITYFLLHVWLANMYRTAIHNVIIY